MQFFGAIRDLLQIIARAETALWAMQHCRQWSSMLYTMQHAPQRPPWCHTAVQDGQDCDARRGEGRITMTPYESVCDETGGQSGAGHTSLHKACSAHRTQRLYSAAARRGSPCELDDESQGKLYFSTQNTHTRQNENASRQRLVSKACSPLASVES